MAITIEPYDWISDAACRDLPVDWWFPTQGEPFDIGVSICRSCPVQVECGTYALNHPELVGIWGGLTDRGRKRLRADILAART